MIDDDHPRSGGATARAEALLVPLRLPTPETETEVARLLSLALQLKAADEALVAERRQLERRNDAAISQAVEVYRPLEAALDRALDAVKEALDAATAFHTVRGGEPSAEAVKIPVTEEAVAYDITALDLEALRHALQPRHILRAASDLAEETGERVRGVTYRPRVML